VFIQNAGPIEANNFLTRAWDDMKLRRNIHELMMNWMILYKVLKKTAALHATHLNTTLQVERSARHNIVLNIRSFQSDGGVFLYNIFSGSPKEKNRENSGNPGDTCCSHTRVV
jgi:hypothetical protein